MDRRHFIYAGAIVGLYPLITSFPGGNTAKLKSKRVGIIGLDTSHAMVFTKLLNSPADTSYDGYRVVAAYPFGSSAIANNAERIEKNSIEIKQYGVEIVDSIAQLLNVVDCVLLETNDGNLHLEQAIPVIQARKPLFIDKPIANSREDAQKIFDLANQYSCPVFSSSALRFIPGIQVIDKTLVLGADIYTPAETEPSHKDLYWYGIHGVEMLFALMGCGCQYVRTVHRAGVDVVVGEWEGGRLGTLRAIRNGKQDFGGKVFLGNEILDAGGFDGYETLLQHIVHFFEDSISPFDAQETLEICGFIDAAYESRCRGGVSVAVTSLETLKR